MKREWSTNIIKVLMVLFMTWILVLLLFFENTLEYMCKKEFFVSNICIALLFVVAGIVCFFVQKTIFYNKLSGLILQYADRIVIIIAISFFFLQLYISYNIFFETGWDSGAYVIPAARLVSQHAEMAESINNYFSFYPNNLLLVNIYALILKVNQKIGIFCGEEQLMSIVFCNCLISSITCLLTYKIGKKITNVSYAFVGYLISLALIALSPWGVICYSDSFVLFIPILILYVYISGIPVFWKTVSLFICGYVGYSIKPQAVICLIAVLIACILQFDRTTIRRKNIFRCFCGVAVSVLLIICMSYGLNKVYEKEGFILDSQKKIGMTHFLMMGMNPDTLGIYNGEDVEISHECRTPQERTKENLEVVRERLKSFGIGGYFKLLSQKMLTNFNDGTFAWGEEGSFYAVMKADKNTAIAPRLKATFYNDGAHFWLYSGIVQVTWIIVLILCFFRSIIGVFDKDKMKNSDWVICLSLIGIIVFELLFEARARYIYIYVPMFILYGMSGIEQMKKSWHLSFVKRN